MADLVFTGQNAGTPLNSDAMPANKDLVIYKGDFVDLLVPVTVNGVAKDLTGYSARAVLKKTYEDTTPVLFEASIPNPASGMIRVYLSSAVSSGLTVGSYVWDVEYVNNINDAKTAMTGDVTVYPEVTTINSGPFTWTVNFDPASFRGDAAGTPSATGQYVYTRFNIVQQNGTLSNLVCTVNTQTAGAANGIASAVIASPPALWTPNAPTTTWTSVPDWGTTSTQFVLTAVNSATTTKLQANWTGIAGADFPTTFTFTCANTPNTSVVITAALNGTTSPYLDLSKVTITKVVG